jgi:outer membrane protein assembly factor BamB
MVIGTPAYMSPEQTEGDDIGPGADVFSLGAVLVMAATGVGPFGEGPPMVLLRRILTTEPNLGALEEPLRGVVAECLRLDVAGRPTAAQLVERLEPVPVPPPTGEETAVLPAATVAVTRVAETPTRSPLGRRAFLIGTGAVLAGVGVIPFVVPDGLPSRTAAWTFVTPTPVKAIAATGDTVYAANDQTVTALDARTGEVRWSWFWYDPITSLAVAGTALAIGIGGLTVLIDGSDKSARWKNAGDALLAATDGLVLMEGFREGAFVMYARDTATGNERWSHPKLHTAENDNYRSHAVSADAVHFCLSDRVDTIDIATGELRWTRPVLSQLAGRTLAVLGDLLCVVESPDPTHTFLQALDAATGTERWRQACDQESTLAADGPSVYLASSTHFTARRPDTGEKQWELPSGSSSLLSAGIAAAANGPVVAGTSSRGTDLIAVRDGQPTWAFKGDPVESTETVFGPLIAGRSAVVAARTKVYSVALD